MDFNFIMWKFDTSKLDHRQLAKLDAGIIGNDDADDYYTEGENDYNGSLDNTGSDGKP